MYTNVIIPYLCEAQRVLGDTLPETRWASHKYGIITFLYIVASCWIFLYELYCDARIHERQIYYSAQLYTTLQYKVFRCLVIAW
jgi:hypothetical protein